MMALVQDIRYAARQLRKAPGFAITAVLTLAIGISSCTAIFSIVNAVLLQPLPFPHPERLVSLQVLHESPDSRSAPIATADTSYPNFFDWRSKNKSFEAMTSYANGNFTLTPVSGGEARRVAGVVVASDFFSTLEVNPELGRTFQRSEENAGQRSIVISHGLWKSEFQEQRDVIGKSLRVNDEVYTVIGVMPEGFSFPVNVPDAALWLTMAAEFEGKHPSALQRGWNQISVLGRLKAGVGIQQAEAEMNSLQRSISRQYPDDAKKDTGLRAIPELKNIVGNVQGPLRLLFGAVCSLLLIACANVAGLLLARATSRSGELAIRAALGASRAQILRQVLVESLTLSLLGGLCGTLIAMAFIKAAPRLLPADLPRIGSITMDGRAVLFALGASILTGVLFGAFPAWRMSKLDPSAAMRDGSRGTTSGRKQHRLHSALVVAETAICLVLLVGAGLLIRSFDRVLRVDPGFQPQNVLTFRIGLPLKRYSPEQSMRFFNDLMPRLSRLPGVEAATNGFPLPLSGTDISISFSIDGRPIPKGDEPNARVTLSGPNFFQSLGIPLKQGRLFNPIDHTEHSQPVMIVNEAFAKKYFSGERAIGKHITAGFGSDDKKPSREIIGIVGDVKRENLTEEAQPEYYIPIEAAFIAPPAVALRVTGNPLSFANSVRSVVSQIDNSLPVYRIGTYEQDLRRSTAQQRFQTILLGAFALIALLLAAIGLYAVLNYMVAQRITELGVRMALGAKRGDILRLILNRGLMLAGIGLAVGLIASTLLTRFIASLLYGVQPHDPLTFVMTTLVLLGVSCLSGLVPAYRASILDPNETLRSQ